MIRKDLPKCPFCGADARAWEWNGGARVECSAWNSNNGEEHYASIGGKTLEEAEKKWCERFALSDELPPVKPTRKKGKWIKSNIGGAKVCSICQAHMGLSNFNYCPNCGAKMESEEE